MSEMRRRIYFKLSCYPHDMCNGRYVIILLYDHWGEDQSQASQKREDQSQASHKREDQSQAVIN